MHMSCDTSGERAVPVCLPADERSGRLHSRLLPWVSCHVKPGPLSPCHHGAGDSRQPGEEAWVQCQCVYPWVAYNDC